MSHFNTRLLSSIATRQDIDEIFCAEVESAVNELLNTELTVFLDYEKYDPIGYNSGNLRNGYYTRTLKTKYGEIHVEVPRDRNSEFNQQTIPSYKRQTSD